MAEPRADQSGFTLTEMLVAMSILLFGLTAIAGSMMMGASTRRGTEMRLRAVHMIDHVFHFLEEEYMLDHDPETGPLPAIGAGNVKPGVVAGYPGMKYSVRFVPDPDHPEVVLAKVRVSWKEQGESVAESFQRILIREKPFHRRVANLRGSK